MAADLCMVVTGASGFLGKAVVAAAGRDPRVTRLISVHRSSLPETALPNEQALHADLAHDEGVVALERAIAPTRGSRLSLIHCAGHFPELGPLHGVPSDVLSRTLNDNLISFVGSLRAVVPSMRSARWGRVVAFSSHARADHYPFMGAFNLAKAALESALQTVANENARFGISANMILIATMMTEVERAIKPNGSYLDWLDPVDVANIAVKLALSEDDLLNGSSIHYWKHSDSFFGQSAFERNSIERDSIDP